LSENYLGTGEKKEAEAVAYTSNCHSSTSSIPHSLPIAYNVGSFFHCLHQCYCTIQLPAQCYCTICGELFSLPASVLLHNPVTCTMLLYNLWGAFFTVCISVTAQSSYLGVQHSVTSSNIIQFHLVFHFRHPITSSRNPVTSIHHFNYLEVMPEQRREGLRLEQVAACTDKLPVPNPARDEDVC